MRSYDPKYNKEELESLNAEPWQLDLLKLNPSYVFWGPHEDYMWKETKGWDSSVLLKTWSEMWKLDELNECVNFYFNINRDNVKCEACDGSSYAPDAKRISDTFYDFDNTGQRWCDKITQDELDALHKGKRCVGKSLEEVNKINKKGRGLDVHDAINRWILIEARCKRLGYELKCSNCNGTGYVYTAPKAHVELVLWILHPRKGCSRGVEIKNIEKDELFNVFAWLRNAAARNTERFSKIPN